MLRSSDLERDAVKELANIRVIEHSLTHFVDVKAPRRKPKAAADTMIIAS